MNNEKELGQVLCLDFDETAPENYTGAIEYADGRKEWCQKGQLHREDGPAHEGLNDHKQWWVNGKCHRVDGPAVERGDGHKEWFLNGIRHRKDGPAIECVDGYKAWWLNNVCFFSNFEINYLQSNYVILERGIPTDKMFGELRLTNARLLTAYGTMFYYDNLPGLEIK